MGCTTTQEKEEGDGNNTFCAITEGKKKSTVAVFVALQQKEKKRRRRLQPCHRLLRYVATKENEEVDGNVATVAFCVVAKNKKVTATTLLSPSLLRYNKRKRIKQRQQHCRRLLHCATTKENEEGDDNNVAVAFFATLECLCYNK